MQMNRNIRKWIAGVIITAMAVGMVCIWPFSLLRREMPVASGNDDYAYTDNLSGEKLVQFLTAAESYLYSVDVVLDYEYAADQDVAIFRFLKEDGTVITEEEIPLVDARTNNYYEITIGKWLKKGEIYYYEIDLSNVTSEVHGVYTYSAENHNKDNISLQVGSREYEGQAVVRYTWGIKLNWKNIICIWACLITAGTTLFTVIMNKGGADKKL